MQRRDFLKGSLVAGASAAGVRSTVPLASSEPAREAAIVPFDLRCESLTHPLGIDARRPRLSWKLQAVAGTRNQAQSAYRITVASTEALLASGTADVWDSGRVSSSRQLHVAYAGRPLASGERCFWQVQVWDADGRPSAPGTASWWEMGLLSPEDWTAFWISDGKEVPPDDASFYEDDPSPLFRRRFDVDRPVRRARLYAVGLGYGVFSLNGRAVSDHALEPAWTSVQRRVYYTTYDVTQALAPGENVLGAMLGNGWYNPLPLRMWGRINLRDHLAVGRPRLLAQLVIEYDDGTTQTVASDETWQVTSGPVLRNSVYLGEHYDARRERPGWDQPAYDDAGWQPAVAAEADDPAYEPGTLQACPIPPIRVTARLTPVSLTEVEPGVFIYDLGQNFAGWVRLRVHGPRGTTVRMRMGERLYPDGTLNPMTSVAGQIKGLTPEGTPRGGPGAPAYAWQSNTYTLRGSEPEEPEVYTPRFTFHGLRYVEVTGFPGTPQLASIEGLRLNTDVAPAGSFACSNERLNRIHRATQWTLLSNLFSVQSDCPAREKFQYGGDIVASSEMALFGYDIAAFYAKTVSDYRDAVRGEGWFPETAPFVGIAAESYAPDAGPIGWGLAHPLLLAQLYQYYGDRRIVEEHYDAARTWVDLLERNADGYLVDRCIGDHESLDPKPIALMATAHFFQAARLVAGFAALLGRLQDETRYRQLARRIRSAFVERFLEPGTGRFGIATQAAQATALYLGLAPEHEVDAATRHMVDEVRIRHGGHIAAGIFGTKYLLNALSTTGHADVAYGMVDTPAYPGWGYMLEQGATTLWETWAESDNVYSQNHPMFGSVSEWFYKWLGGIQPEDTAVGFDRFRIAPCMPEGLQWVDARYASVRGTIRSRWRIEENLLYVDVEIPVNATATLELPTREPGSVREGGQSIRDVASLRPLPAIRAGMVRFELGSGRYMFIAVAP